MGWEGVSWVDWALLTVLLISVVVGFVRGLLFEVMSLLGWVVAYIAAQVFAPELAPRLPVAAPGSALRVAAALVLVFVLALMAWGVLSWVLRKLVQASPLSGLDRLFGAGFGLLRGILLGVIVATVLPLTPMANSTAWQTSRGAVWLGAVIDGLRPWLPADVARHLGA